MFTQGFIEAWFEGTARKNDDPTTDLYSPNTAGLYGRVAMKSFPYSDTQKQVRMAFCNHVIDQWKKDKENYLSKIFSLMSHL
jgi:hypothetical protein